TVKILFYIILAGGLGWLLWRTLIGREVGRRVVFLFVGLAVSGAILANITLPVKETTVVRNVFETVDNLPEESTILLSLDYDPSAQPELQPMANAILRHAFTKNHKVVLMTLWATGGAMVTYAIDTIIRAEFPELVYGVDYCNVGYRAGNEAVLRVIATDFRKTFSVDVNNTSVGDLEIFEGIFSCGDFDYLVVIGSGKPGVKEWVEFVGDPADALVGAGANAVSAPQLFPYYPEQLNGMLGGSKGASEYESLLARHYPQFKAVRAKATEIMGPQTIAHVVVLLLIVFGNISYFKSRSARGGSA
ncbi:MAG: hypothetical protein ACE5GA_10700, partial [Candidatus Zixiibacteriota bacterium]